MQSALFLSIPDIMKEEMGKLKILSVHLKGNIKYFSTAFSMSVVLFTHPILSLYCLPFPCPS